MLLRRAQSQLLVIDVQERLAPHIEGGPHVVANVVRLLGYAGRLGVPATVTEHYPRGLGGSVEAVRRAAAVGTRVCEKITFSCWQDEGIRTRLEAGRADGRTQVVVAGMEAHVCVGQTALDLVGAGLDVYLVADAVGSREATVRDIAIRRLEAAGVRLVTHEMVAFEWLGRGDAPEIKDILQLLK